MSALSDACRDALHFHDHATRYQFIYLMQNSSTDVAKYYYTSNLLSNNIKIICIKGCQRKETYALFCHLMSHVFFGYYCFHLKSLVSPDEPASICLYVLIKWQGTKTMTSGYQNNVYNVPLCLFHKPAFLLRDSVRDLVVSVFFIFS